MEPTKLIASIPGWSQIASTASLPPCTTWSTPSGSPASRSSSAIRPALSGTSSEGLRMRQLPSAIALGIDQFGTMLGKLNGVIAATTPSGIALDPALHAAAHLEHLARRDLRQRAGELGQLGGLEHLGAGLARDLPVLLGDQRRQLVDVLLEQRLVAVEDLDPLLDRRGRPAGEGRPRALDGAVHLAAGRERNAGDDAALARIVHLERGEIVGDERSVQVVARRRGISWLLGPGAVTVPTACRRGER